MLNRGMHTGFFPDVCVMITAYAYNLDKVLGCIPGSARTTDPKTWKKKYLDGHRPSWQFCVIFTHKGLYYQ